MMNTCRWFYLTIHLKIAVCQRRKGASEVSFCLALPLCCWAGLRVLNKCSENSFRLINLERKAYANALFQFPFYLGHFEVFSLARCGAIFSQDPWFTCLLSTVASLSWSWITVTVEQRVFPFYKSVLKDLP